MTNPITLKEQAIEDFLNNPPHGEAEINGFLRDFAMDVLQMVEEGLPSANKDELYADNMTEAEHGWDNCRVEVLARISALKDSFSGEGV